MQFTKVDQLLRIHQRYKGQKLELQKVLGDSFLLKHNVIYRNIRRTSIHLDFKYVESWPAYFQAPLLELGRIQRKKLIPYLPSAVILKNLEKKHPGLFQFQQLPCSIASFHFHESSHAVVYCILKSFRPKNERHVVLKVLMEESFANAAEIMASVFADNKVHSFYLQQNSYGHDMDRDRAIQKAVFCDLGFQRTFLLNFYAYLHSNFLIQSVSPKGIRFILEMIDGSFQPNRKILQNCARVVRQAQALNLGFRSQTARFHLMSLGMSPDLYKNLNFDFMALIKEDGRLLRLIQKMAQVAEFGPSCL